MLKVTIGLAMVGVLLSGVVQAQETKAPNTGQDETRPLTRFDLKYQYQNPGGSDAGHTQIITARVDKPFALSADWEVASRADVPVYVTDAVGSDNPDGRTTAGLGDLLVQGLLVYAPPSERFALATGPRLVFPTAREDQMGAGRWRIVSTVESRYFTPEITDGSWVGLVVRYDVDFAGDDSRRHIGELQLGPRVYMQFPDTWFLQFFPSSDIRYNAADMRPGDTGRWFVPLDLVVGRMMAERFIVSGEASVPIVNDYKVYDFKVEARIGFFF
jgi:hypothetical protein